MKKLILILVFILSAALLFSCGDDGSDIPEDGYTDAEYNLPYIGENGKISAYVTDFPNDAVIGATGVIAIPHLGASTPESEDNCAVMAVKQVAEYLENGSIINSVNYPAVELVACDKHRITIMHKNISGIVSKITSAFANEDVNIDNMVNKSKGEYAYTVVDSDTEASAEAISALKKINGIIRIRVIK